MADQAVHQLLRHQLATRGKVRIKKPPRWLFPDPAERRYTAMLLKTIRDIREAYMEILFPRLPGLVLRAQASRPSKDSASRVDADWPDDLEGYTEQIRKKTILNPKSAEAMAAQAGEDIAEWNAFQFKKVVRVSMKINLFQREPWLETSMSAFAKGNADLIESLQSNVVREIQSYTMTGLTGGLRHEEIAKNIVDRFGVAESRAEFIARDQTAKLNAQLTENRQTQLGVKEYIWRTAGDDRVRDSHAEKDGRTFAWDDPPADTGNPGEDYQCRCTAEPVLQGLLAGLEE